MIPKNQFIEETAREDMPYTDLQAVVEARCLQTGEDSDELLAPIWKRQQSDTYRFNTYKALAKAFFADNSNINTYDDLLHEATNCAVAVAKGVDMDEATDIAQDAICMLQDKDEVQVCEVCGKVFAPTAYFSDAESDKGKALLESAGEKTWLDDSIAEADVFCEDCYNRLVEVGKGA